MYNFVCVLTPRLPFSTCVCTLVKDQVLVTPASELGPDAIAGIVFGAVALLGKL